MLQSLDYHSLGLLPNIPCHMSRGSGWAALASILWLCLSKQDLGYLLMWGQLHRTESLAVFLGLLSECSRYTTGKTEDKAVKFLPCLSAQQIPALSTTRGKPTAFVTVGSCPLPWWMSVTSCVCLTCTVIPPPCSTRLQPFPQHVPVLAWSHVWPAMYKECDISCDFQSANQRWALKKAINKELGKCSELLLSSLLLMFYSVLLHLASALWNKISPRSPL